MEATGTMPADMPPMAFSTAMGNIPSNATGINSLTQMPAMPTMSGAPSMLDMMGTSCKIDVSCSCFSRSTWFSTDIMYHSDAMELVYNRCLYVSFELKV